MSQNQTKTKKYNLKTVIISTILILAIFLIPSYALTPTQEVKEIQEEANQAEIIKQEKERLEKQKKELEIDVKIKELELEKEKIKNVVKPVEVEAMEAKKEAEKETVETVSDLELRKSKINQYFAKYTPGTPLTADIIVKYADMYQIPDGFFLAVCHNESHCGTKGRAVPTKNPFNVGNVTAGDNKPTNCQQYSNCLDSFEEGVEKFAKLIKEKYFYENEKIGLETWISRDFRAVRGDVKGGRYMTDTQSLTKYQERIKNLQILQIYY